MDDSFCAYKWITSTVDTTKQTCVIKTWMFKHRHVSACLDKQGIPYQEGYTANECEVGNSDCSSRKRILFLMSDQKTALKNKTE